MELSVCASCCSHAGDVGRCVKELSLVYLPAAHKHSWESSCYLGYFGVKSIKEKNMEKEGAELAYCMPCVCVRVKQAALWLVWGHKAVRPCGVIREVPCGFSLSPWVEIWALKHCQAVPVPAACLSPGLDRLRSWSFICIVSFSLQTVLAVGELANLFSTQMSNHSQNHCAPVCFFFFFPSCQGHGAFWDFFLTAHSRWALVLGIPPAVDQCPVALQEQAPVTPSVFAPWAIKPWALHTCIFVDRYQYWKITCYVAWLLWGGEVARTWFLGVAADGCASSFHDIGGEIQDLEHCMRNQVYISK